jgi:ABC-type methionine transport system ATPase subunit
MSMKSVRVRLEYPLERVSEPVVTRLVKDFDVSPNVLAADIEATKGGWMVLGLTGEPGQVDKALAWIKTIGVGLTVE